MRYVMTFRTGGGLHALRDIGLCGLLLGLAGCATDHEQSLNRKMDTLGTALRSQMGDLKRDFAAQERRHDELARTLDGMKTAIYSTVDKLGRQCDSLQRETKAATEVIRSEQGLRQQIQGVQQDMSALNATMEQIAPLATTLDGQMQSLTTALRDSYKVELTALKERLKTLEQLGKQLDGTVVREGESPAKETAPRVSAPLRD
jgi:DNA repair exonuclease SbcCD ATPase subunit